MEQDIEQIELYILNMLPNAEHNALAKRIENDKELQKLEAEHRAFLRLIEHKSSKQFIANQLSIIKKEQSTTINTINDTLKYNINKYWRTASVAASVACVASILTFNIAKNSFNKKYNTDLTNLSKKIKSDINRIETKTNAISKKVNVIPEQPKGTGKQSGTAFAISNNGYVITNQHVIDIGGDVYVFTPDNIGHKCEIISTDKELDIAVLKINEKDFSFGNKPLPYNLSNSNSSMAQKVYTLGFPKNSVVYNEGYISSIYGNNDDSSRYQMELPSSPGVSGSPVFDEKGNVVGLINSKQSISEGITYALKSKKIIKYLKGIDSLNIPTNNALSVDTRANQIKKIQDFVFVVKVY